MQSHNCFKSQQQVICYKKNSSLQYKWAQDTINKYYDIFKNVKNICDIGCGSGTITQLIAFNHNSNILGIDSSFSQIELAFQLNNNSNIRFQLQDVTTMIFEECFDLVFSNCCLHWLLDQNIALRNIHRSLVQGGRAIIILPAKDDSNLSIITENIVSKNKWKPYFKGYISPRSYYSEDEYKQLLLNNSFEPIDINVSCTDTEYNDIDALRNWIKPINPHYNHLTDDKLKEDFLNEFMEQVLLHTQLLENGRIVLKSKKLEILASK